MKMSILSKFHILGIIYVIFNFDLWYYWEITDLKYGLLSNMKIYISMFQNTCFKKRNNMEVEENLRVTIGSYI